MMHETVKAEIIDIFDKSWLKVLQQIPHDIYNLPQYLALEAKRISAIPEAILVSQGENILFLPYLLRQCYDMLQDVSLTSEIFDIISPYGYPGILLSDAASKSPEFVNLAVSEMKQLLRSRGVCSAFIRLHPLINDQFSSLFNNNQLTEHGQTVSIDLTLSPEQLWNQTKPDRRNKINKSKRMGLTSRIVNFDEYIDEFIIVYEETMERVGANKLYLDFDKDYCLKMKYFLGDKLHLCAVEFEEKIASIGLYSEYNGIVQALFGGTKTEFINYSPNSLEIDYIRFWAKERGNQILHLGGGLGGTKNSLFEFKSGFSKQRHSFQTISLIIDEDSYYYLVEARAKYLNINPKQILQINFFPAYRAVNKLKN